MSNKRRSAFPLPVWTSEITHFCITKEYKAINHSTPSPPHTKIKTVPVIVTSCWHLFWPIPIVHLTDCRLFQCSTVHCKGAMPLDLRCPICAAPQDLWTNLMVRCCKCDSRNAPAAVPQVPNFVTPPNFTASFRGPSYLWLVTLRQYPLIFISSLPCLSLLFCGLTKLLTCCTTTVGYFWLLSLKL